MSVTQTHIFRKLLFAYFLLFMLAFDSFAGRSSCVDTYTDPNRPINGRVAAKELYKSVRLQLLDIDALNLKNGGTQKENSVSNLNSSISITLNDFDNFTTAGKTWLLYENYDENFSINMNIGTANNSTPQTWSLPANFLNNFEGAGRSDFINMADVPLALRITGANKFMRTAYYDENDRPMNVYDQYNLANDGVYHVGESYDLEVGSDDSFDEVDYEVADVPLDLNDTFTSTNEEANYITNLKTSKEIHSVSVNAFGAIITPTGTYNCLRMMSVVEKYTRPNESSNYTLVSTTNHVTFFTKTGEYFTAKVSGTSGNVTASEITYRSVVQTSSLSENKDVKLNNDSKGVTINVDNDNAHPSAILDVKSDSLGILIPRIAKANRPNSPATGLLVYQIDNTPGFYYYDGTTWRILGSSPSARIATEENLKTGIDQLVNGSKFIKFETPQENPENIVIQIQLEGDCNGIYISNKTREGFEVKELQKGKSNVKFSWKMN
jgi:hypothetical protein